jgi:dienelactone hydrolase
MQSPQRKRRWRRALTFLAVLGCGYLLVCFALAKLYVSPPRQKLPALRLFKRTVLADNEPVWASPGLLAGKPKGHTLYVMVHGYGGGVGHWSDIGSELVVKGHEVVLPELCAHGDSPDACCGFGTKESQIIVDATRWARSRYSTPPRVVLVGVSMGGSAAWLATAKAPDLFDAIVTEGAFTRLDDVADNWFDSRLPAGHLIFWPVKSIASRIAGVDPSTVNPIEAAKQWHVKPALVVHCADDALMKESYARDLARASGANVWVIPGAQHANGASVAKAEYLKRLLALAS